MHRVEAQRAQRHRPALLRFAQVEQEVEPLPRRDVGLLDALRGREQAAVRSGEITAERAPVLKKGQPVAARIRPVEDSESVDAARSLDERLLGQVDQQAIADEALERLVGGRLIAQPALGVEAAVLQHQWNLGFAQREIQRAAQRPLLIVFDEQQAGQAVVGLLRDEPVRMRVVPVHRGAVVQLERVLVGLAGACHDEPVAIVARVVAQPVPVDDGRFIELVDHAHPDLIAAARQQCRVQVGLAARLGGVGDVSRTQAGQHLDFAAHDAQFAQVGGTHHAVQPARSGQAQRVGECRRLLLDVHNLAHRPYAIFAIGGCGENVASSAHCRAERRHAAQEMSSCQTRHLAHLFAP
jgi:hypothetical protein